MPYGMKAVFALIVNPVLFPLLFVGYAFIPAIRSIELDGPLAVGATRRIHNTDGSVLTECVDVLDPPNHHVYTLSGFRVPFSWLVTRGVAEWRISADAAGSKVRWDYTFTLTSILAYLPATLVLRVFMARAMRICLMNMANALATRDVVRTT